MPGASRPSSRANRSRAPRALLVVESLITTDGLGSERVPGRGGDVVRGGKKARRVGAAGRGGRRQGAFAVGRKERSAFGLEPRWSPPARRRS